MTECALSVTGRALTETEHVRSVTDQAGPLTLTVVAPSSTEQFRTVTERAPSVTERAQALYVSSVMERTLSVTERALSVTKRDLTVAIVTKHALCQWLD